MARLPLTEQQVAEDWLILNLENVAFSEEQFVELCADNRDFRFELTAQKELVIMTPPGRRPGGKIRRLVRILKIGRERMEPELRSPLGQFLLFQTEPNGGRMRRG